MGTPIAKVMSLENTSSEGIINIEKINYYQLVIGSLIYAMLAIHPNLAYTVSVFSKYSLNP